MGPAIGKSPILWILFGASLSLFSVDVFRITMPMGLKLPPPVVLALIVAGAGFFKLMINKRDVVFCIPALYRVLFWLTLVFWGWHWLGMARAEEIQWAWVELVKLTVGLLVFWSLMLYSGADSRKLELAMVFCLWGAAILLGFLIYKYVWVFHSPYLGISIGEPTRENRNQLAWFLAISLPYAAAYFFRGPGKWRGLIPLLVMMVAWLYTSSRGSWVCGSLGIFWAVGVSRGTGFRLILGKGVILSVVLISVVFLVWVKVLPFIQADDFDMIKRLGSLVSSQEMANDYSYGVRKELVENSLNNFEKNPILGSGLTNSRIQHSFVSHNDILGIMSELGAIGIVIFGGIMALVLRVCLNSIKGSWLKAGAQGSVIALVIYLGLINVYTTTAFWTILFFSLAICEIADMSSSPSKTVQE